MLVEHFAWCRRNGIHYHQLVNVSMKHSLYSPQIRMMLDNPCTNECELCEKKTGVCLRQPTRLTPLVCDPPCDKDEVCIDGECIWSNVDEDKMDDQCYPSCPFGTQCVNRQCQSSLTPYCPVVCRPGQVCVDGRCGCYKG